MDISESPRDVPAQPQENIPGAVPEIHVPVRDPAVDSGTQARGETTVPVYSPRSSFVPPDIEVAKLHAKENRPMKLDSSTGQFVPYALAMRPPHAAFKIMHNAGMR